MKYNEKDKMYNNPIIPGFYPDPSICRVGDDYYLVNSTFEYFPAIPVWHSKDLVHWEQICNAIDREEQGLNLDVNVSGGVQAATIRYNPHNETYYITSTCVGKTWPSLKYNFIITAKNPAGPWSKVKYLDDAPGIDSSLFFNDDKKAYFHANRQKLNQEELGNAEIWVQELDLDTLDLIGEKHVLWDGEGGIFPEGPHIYKRNGYYYLMIAEGGTGHWHTVTMARSKHIYGPYVPNPRNPLLTHKHLSRSYPIQNVGHADIVETQNGDWYMVCLGARPKGDMQPVEEIEYSQGGHYYNMGRESFLMPIKWEDDIAPVVSPESGKVELSYPFPNLEEHKWLKRPNCSHFDNDRLELFWNCIRNEKMDFYSLTEREGYLRLHLGKNNITEDKDVSFLGRRQTDWYFEASTKLEMNFKEVSEQCGMTAYFNYKAHIRMFLEQKEDGIYLSLAKRDPENDKLIDSIKVDVNKIKLKIVGNERTYSFYYNIGTEDKWIKLRELDGSILNSTVGGGHTGSYLGIYGYTPNELDDNYVDFSYFEYNELK